jgi:phospholipid/cholesterol/gamma-HCH transport system substrate-binding protein
MRRKLDVELKAGIFLFFGLVVAMITILMMGGAKSIFEKHYRIKLEVSDANGISVGGAIRSGGLKIGMVEDIAFTPNYNNILITMKINQDFQQRIRQDSVVRFQTQGVLGDKYLEVAGGTMDKPVIADGGSIEAETGKDFNAMLAEGSSAVGLLKDNLQNLKTITTVLAQKNQMATIMKDLQATASNLKDVTSEMKSANMGKDISSTLKNLKVVSDRLKNGEGTIGALFADSTLYEDLKNLIGGANRNNVLKFFVRQAVKSADEAAAEEQKKPAKKK